MTKSSDVILEIPCPEHIYQTLRAEGFDKDTLSREARTGLAIQLYGAHRLSPGKAAELADLPLVKFMELLRVLHLPVNTYGEEEYAEDLQTITGVMRSRDV